MDIRSHESKQRSSDIYNGQTQAASVGGSITPGSALQIYVQVMDPGYVAANRAEVAEAVDETIRHILAEAAREGLPVGAEAGGGNG